MNDLKTIVENLYIKYHENPYALNRLQYYINNLSLNIINDLNNYEKRLNRTNELTMEYDIFCNVFLSKHKYYYLPNNNCFYNYDNKTYKIIKEDDIQYNLLTTITEQGKLMQWKHKTKLHIIKLIKDRHLFKSIPETYTIQNILGFLQTTLFGSKNAAKYFLTILGDNLLKKNVSCIYFINSNIKIFLQLIDEIASITFGSSITHNFLSKHHETHNLSNYRLIKNNDIQISYDVVKDMLNKLGMDLLCVASHYSERYNSAENFLNVIKEDKDLKNHVLFLSNISQEEIIDNFINECFVMSNDNTIINEKTLSISWKNMHYIWKLYLSNIHIPNMIYSNNLKEILKLKLQYKEDNDLFINITSKYLPQISNFLQFWQSYIIQDQDFSENINNTFNEYEIDELITLFKSVNTINMNEEDMIKFIRHFFYPTIMIKDDKYISNIKCSLWDKCKDIQLSLENYKEILKSKSNNYENNVNILISFDDLYDQYRNYCINDMYVNKVNSLIVSKHYFEKYIEVFLSEYLQFEKFISYNWIYS
jgi:hypothetical protein